MVATKKCRQVRREEASILFPVIIEPRMLPKIRGCTPLRLAYDFVARISSGRTTSQAIRQTQSPRVFQSAMGSQTVVIGELSDEVQQELKAGAEFVLKASYTESTPEGYSACKEVEPLVKRFPKVLALHSGEVHAFSTRFQPDPAQSRRLM
ncbi:hypothetical protein CC80DRAFT_141467 [Byssothecium circinans]|uniref:Uncharacterized protein n=1 Tax=Byssothecium circinans TaxID=147558 RepID=A0A6A5TMY0_9PLEO|nr:hypothetical protein CC80DRAFT_141467 [Byssothecium circinans]